MSPRRTVALSLALLSCTTTPATAPQPAIVVFAQDGTLRRNPDLDARLELVVRTSEGVRSVVGQLEGTDLEVAGVDQGGGRFLLTFELGALGDGEHTLIAQGEGAGVVVEPARRTLRIGRNGVQHTAFDEVGTALSPQLHRLDERLALTWTDRRNDLRRLYLQYLGADLRPLGEPVALTDAELTVSRATVAYDGEGRLGVLMQTLEGEGRRQNRVMVVSLEGEELMAPVSIDPEDAVGRPGGGLSFDGEAFVAVARSAAPGRDDIRWVRFSAEGIMTQPSVVASAGDGQPIGGFLPYMTLTVAADGDLGFVGFKRERYEPTLDMQIQRNHVAVVERGGAVVRTEELPTQLNLSFDPEVSLHRVQGDTVALWTSTDLTAEEANPPYLLYGNRADAEVGPSRWRPLLLSDAPLDRTEFTLADDPSGYAQMLWQDLRLRAEDEDERLRLMVAPLSRSFRLGTPRVLRHPRLTLGVSSPSMVAHQGRLIMAWVDVRSSQGAEVRSEIYLESCQP